MISLRSLTFSRNGEPLIKDASLQVHAGWKIGLTGANGCGKSSFFSLLRNELHADSGALELPERWTIAHVAQDTPALPDAALDFVLDGDAELRQIERDLAEAESHHDAAPTSANRSATCMHATARSAATRPGRVPPS
jgi:ATP-binding cassette subfamily F protein 3